MRYENLGQPFGDDWTFDEAGIIHTPSGYRCTPKQIEGMLWLFGCLPFKPERLLMHSDEAPGALRPLYEHADIDGKIKPTRLRLVKEQSAGNNAGLENEATGSSPEAPHDRPTTKVAR